MITFDPSPAPPDPIEELRKSQVPDLIEFGENDSSWLRLDRKKMLVVVVSKVTGRQAATCPLETAGDRLGLTPLQLQCARTASMLRG